MSPALSTMWCQLRHHQLSDFMSAAQAMGFEHVELSHIVTLEMLNGLPAAFFSPIRVLHHPCPNPGGVPDLNALEGEVRESAIQNAIQTLEWAAHVGAEAVVMHLGVVAEDRRWENAIRARWLQGERKESLFATLAAHIRMLRQAKASLHWEAVCDALERLLPVAERLGVPIVLENGEWCFSMPNLSEAEALLEKFESPFLGLWLDTGHATIQERLGFDSLLAWAQLAPERLFGLHYHDVDGLRDHLIPGNGSIDWAALAAVLPSHVLPTCEFDWYYTPEELVAGVAHLATYGLVSWDVKKI